MDLLIETYSELDAAIGWAAMDGYTITDTLRTHDDGLVAQGYTTTFIVLDCHGVKWTAHHDPRTGLYAGAHLSRGTPKDKPRRRRR